MKASKDYRPRMQVAFRYPFLMEEDHVNDAKRFLRRPDATSGRDVD